MTRQAIIEKTLQAINKLPEDKAEEISDFADFVYKRYEDQLLAQSIQKMASDSKSFSFLEEEEEVYTVKDLKQVYN
jgi:hypothetical protein